VYDKPHASNNSTIPAINIAEQGVVSVSPTAGSEQVRNRVKRAAGPTLGIATLKASNEDFVVEEVLHFLPHGTGQHLLLKIAQDNWNSAAVARWLGEEFGCRAREIGYCGHKDRHAITDQWFSVPLNERTAWSADSVQWPTGLSLSHSARHNRKLRRGSHRGNRFRIRLRDIDTDTACVDERLGRIAIDGFPNYFGAQRFGRDQGNVARARETLDEAGFRHTRDAGQSLEVSSLRSLMFNTVLAARVVDGSWLRALDGDVMVLDGSRSFFAADIDDEKLRTRLQHGDVHVSGPLWGIGWEKLPPDLVARERKLLEGFEDDRVTRLWHGAARLRALARDLTWRWPRTRVLELEFTLGKGSYATVLLEELFDLRGLSSTFLHFQ
jgi:tRNA pseudouridine13 synthase